jgi:SAM-dependent methyltransferase
MNKYNFFNVDKKLNYGRHIISKFAKESHYKSVLDLGAGQGLDLDIFKKYQPDIKAYAVESWASNIKILEKKGYIVCGRDIEKETLPFKDNSIDCIVLNQILEHTKDIFWIIHECTRVLSLSGSLIIGVPNLAALHNRVYLLFGRQPTCIRAHSAHVRGFTINGIRDFMDIFPGYKLHDFKGSNFYPFSPFLALPLSKIFPNFSVGIFFKFTKDAKYNDEFILYPTKEKLATNFFIG